MAYKYKERYLTVGSSWVDDNGFQHPSDWASKWSKDDLAKWDISIEEDTNNSFDSRYDEVRYIKKSKINGKVIFWTELENLLKFKMSKFIQ